MDTGGKSAATAAEALKAGAKEHGNAVDGTGKPLAELPAPSSAAPIESTAARDDPQSLPSMSRLQGHM